MPLFFFNDTATTEIYTLSLHDALPISFLQVRVCSHWGNRHLSLGDSCHGAEHLLLMATVIGPEIGTCRSEEHTSELQLRQYLVCRLLLEKKKTPSRSNNTLTSFTDKCT